MLLFIFSINSIIRISFGSGASMTPPPISYPVTAHAFATLTTVKRRNLKAKEEI